MRTGRIRQRFACCAAISRSPVEEGPAFKAHEHWDSYSKNKATAEALPRNIMPPSLSPTTTRGPKKT